MPIIERVLAFITRSTEYGSIKSIKSIRSTSALGFSTSPVFLPFPFGVNAYFFPFSNCIGFFLFFSLSFFLYSPLCLNAKLVLPFQGLIHPLGLHRCGSWHTFLHEHVGSTNTTILGEYLTVVMKKKGKKPVLGVLEKKIIIIIKWNLGQNGSTRFMRCWYAIGIRPISSWTLISLRFRKIYTRAMGDISRLLFFQRLIPLWKPGFYS